MAWNVYFFTQLLRVVFTPCWYLLALQNAVQYTLRSTYSTQGLNITARLKLRYIPFSRTPFLNFSWRFHRKSCEFWLYTHEYFIAGPGMNFLFLYCIANLSSVYYIKTSFSHVSSHASFFSLPHTQKITVLKSSFSCNFRSGFFLAICNRLSYLWQHNYLWPGSHFLPPEFRALNEYCSLHESLSNLHLHKTHLVLSCHLLLRVKPGNLCLK